MGNKCGGKHLIKQVPDQYPQLQVQQQIVPITDEQLRGQPAPEVLLQHIECNTVDTKPLAPIRSIQNPTTQSCSIWDNQELGNNQQRQELSSIRQNNLPQVQIPEPQNLDNQFYYNKNSSHSNSYDVDHQTQMLQYQSQQSNFNVNFPYCNTFIIQHLKIRLQQTSFYYGLTDLSINGDNIRFITMNHYFEQIYSDIWKIYREIVSMYIQINHLQIIIYSFNVIPEGLHSIFEDMISLIEQNELEFNDIALNEEKCTITIEIPIRQLSNYRYVCKEYEYNFSNLNYNDEYQFQITYPKEWVPQQQTSLKVPSSDVEQQKICDLFHATRPNSRIHSIQRIQNQVRWKNYAKEKDKLQRFYKATNQELSTQEQELYAWHCPDGRNLIQNQNRIGIHPIYNLIEHDLRASNGDWGYACYFSEEPSECCSYPYPLCNDDNAKQGKKVIICCLLTTGRVKFEKPDLRLRQQADQYDCVIGDAGGITVYMLYDMGACRAYPAYEVIYE